MNFWNGFSGPDGATMEAIVAKFNRENPDVQVRMQIIPWATYYDKVTLGLAFGGAPDVFVVHANRLPEYAKYGALASLDELVSRDEIEPTDFVPKAWAASTYEGHLFALPLDIHPVGLYYNKKLFREAGVVAPPKTYGEFLDVAKRLTRDHDGDGRVDQWGFSFTWLRSNGYTFLNQHGTSLLTEDLKQSALSSEPAKNAISQMLEIIDVHKVAPRPEGQDAWVGFQSGKVAMALEGVYMKTGLDRQEGLEYGVAPVPQFGPVQAVWAGSHLLAMPKDAEGRKRDAGWRFIRYLSDHGVDWADGGQIPARKDLLSDLRFQKMEVQFTLSRQLPYIVYEPQSVANNMVATFGDAAIEASLNKIEPTELALKKASRRIQSALERVK